MDCEKIFLRDEETMILTNENYKEVLKTIDANTNWMKIYFKDVNIKGIDNVPILVESEKEKHNLTSRDDVVISCMENTGICLEFPVENKLVTYPVSTLGYLGVITRAGFGGGPALYYAESTKRFPMPPSSRASVINEGLSTFKDCESNFGYILCRYDRIDAFHSAEYSVLPVSELLMYVEDSLDLNYQSWEFDGGSVSPSFTSLKWHIIDSKLESDLKNILKIKNDFTVCIILLSSDTGTSSAKLYLALQGKSKFPMLIGNPKNLPHKNGNAVSDFVEAADAITGSVRDNIALLQSLTTKKCEHIDGTIRLLSRKFRLPKKIAMQVAEEYGTGYPKGATFYEVFIALQDIIYLYQKDADKVSPEKSFELSEAVVSMLYFEHLSEYDRFFEWAD